MDFTIDDMIEFFESELEYCEKEKDRIHKEHFNNGMVKDKYSFFLGNYVGLSTAYQGILGQLVKLKENLNKKTEELIDWCVVKDKLCSIYEGDIANDKKD